MLNAYCLCTALHIRIFVSRKFLVSNKKRNVFNIAEKKLLFLVQNKKRSKTMHIFDHIYKVKVGK